LIVIKVKVLDI